MIADLKPYAEYKESGLPWLGQVPGHWDSRRLRHACDMRVSNVDKHTKVGETPVRLCNYVEVYKNERIRESTRFMAATASEDERVRFGLRKGDVLITKDSEQWNDIGVPALVEFEAPDVVCGYHLAILRARPGLHGAFLHRALESHFIAAQFHVEANGVTRYGLSHGAIQSVAIPLPPPEEQTAIVRFLDWANGRLERAIRAKRKVIALLNEQKQAIIHRAVTRGLDPSVPLKPSGIAWLGDIPQHWEVSAIGAASVLIQTGPFGSQLHSHEYITGGVPVINPSHMGGGRLQPSPTVTVSDEKAGELSRHMLCAGDIVIARRGELGRCALVKPSEERWICGTGSLLLRCKTSTVNPSFFQAVFASRGIADMLSLSSIGATMANLNASTVARQRLPLPPLDEQQRIVRHIEDETRKVEMAISRLNREIELLREYRTRLVADAVTGKVDVRKAAARLPDEAPLDAVEDVADLGDETEAADEEAAV